MLFRSYVLTDRELLLAADFGDARELALVEVLEDGGLFQQIQVHGVKVRRAPVRGK